MSLHNMTDSNETLGKDFSATEVKAEAITPVSSGMMTAMDNDLIIDTDSHP